MCRLQLDTRLGEGMFGLVRAGQLTDLQDTEVKQQVAVKMLKGSFNEELASEVSNIVRHPICLSSQGRWRSVCYVTICNVTFMLFMFLLL